MSSVTCQISISLDGFVAGSEQSRDQPLGRGGRDLHLWHLGHERANDDDETAAGWLMRPRGAYVMGRNMFGGGGGSWDESWRGWWGENPPFRAPVFVLTHHARGPLSLQGGTTFTFVTDGIRSALDRARTAAGQRDVAIAGGASAVQQYLAAGMLDELYLHLVPVILGSGERLLENIGAPTFAPVKVVDSPKVTHIKYRVVH